MLYRWVSIQVMFELGCGRAFWIKKGRVAINCLGGGERFHINKPINELKIGIFQILVVLIYFRTKWAQNYLITSWEISEVPLCQTSFLFPLKLPQQFSGWIF